MKNKLVKALLPLFAISTLAGCGNKNKDDNKVEEPKKDVVIEVKDHETEIGSKLFDFVENTVDDLNDGVKLTGDLNKFDLDVDLEPVAGMLIGSLIGPSAMDIDNIHLGGNGSIDFALSSYSDFINDIDAYLTSDFDDLSLKFHHKTDTDEYTKSYTLLKQKTGIYIDNSKIYTDFSDQNFADNFSSLFWLASMFDSEQERLDAASKFAGKHYFELSDILGSIKIDEMPITALKLPLISLPATVKEFFENEFFQAFTSNSLEKYLKFTSLVDGGFKLEFTNLDQNFLSVVLDTSVDDINEIVTTLDVDLSLIVDANNHLSSLGLKCNAVLAVESLLSVSVDFGAELKASFGPIALPSDLNTYTESPAVAAGKAIKALVGGVFNGGYSDLGFTLDFEDSLVELSLNSIDSVNQEPISELSVEFDASDATGSFELGVNNLCSEEKNVLQASCEFTSGVFNGFDLTNYDLEGTIYEATLDSDETLYLNGNGTKVKMPLTENPISSAPALPALNGVLVNSFIETNVPYLYKVLGLFALPFIDVTTSGNVQTISFDSSFHWNDTLSSVLNLVLSLTDSGLLINNFAFDFDLDFVLTNGSLTSIVINSLACSVDIEVLSETNEGLTTVVSEVYLSLTLGLFGEVTFDREFDFTPIPNEDKVNYVDPSSLPGGQD